MFCQRYASSELAPRCILLVAPPKKCVKRERYKIQHHLTDCCSVSFSYHATHYQANLSHIWAKDGSACFVDLGFDRSFSPPARWESLDFLKVTCSSFSFFFLRPASCELQISAGTSGLQLRTPEHSGQCRISTARSGGNRCQIESQNECLKGCQIEWKIKCQNKCQKECQIGCQSICQKQCQNECQIEWQNRMSDRMPKNNASE